MIFTPAERRLLALLILMRIRAIAVPYWLKVRQFGADFVGFVGEQLAGTEDVRANGAQGYVMRRFYEITSQWFPFQLRAGIGGYSMGIANGAVFALGTALAFALSAHLWHTGAITIGTAYLT